jgi:energy-converting hydrogenase Eha subunit A
MTPEHLFTKIVVGGKFGAIILFIIFSLINGHVDYIEKNPRVFMTDTILIAVTSAMASAFLTYTRGRPDLWMNHAMFALLLFFFYHVTKEFMGYYALTSDEKTKSQQTQYNIIKYPVMIVVGITVALMIGLSFVVRDTPDFSTGIFSSMNPALALTIETIIVSLLMGSGESIVLFNHGEKRLGRKALETFGLFAGAHLLLQFGGFYEALYSGKLNVALR